MNERIQKLKDQCWVEKRWDNDMWIEKHIDQEKFAELIVQECAKVAYECGPAVVYGSERQFNPVTYTGNQILIHFGVEE
tara:strand:- start:243 stop:479 length:237 start_codon:yes stop_codon:yes gene_type:complete